MQRTWRGLCSPAALAAGLWMLGAWANPAAAEPMIVGFNNDGYLTFGGIKAGTTAVVQWVSSLNDPARTNWQEWKTVVVTGMITRVPWPHYFRVVGNPWIPTNPPPPTNGLVLYMTFDEGVGGSAADRSGNANHGEIRGAQWALDPVRQAVLDFRGGSGTGDCVRVPHAASLVSMQTTRQLSLCAWIKPRTTPMDFPVVISKGGNTLPLAYGGYELVLNGSGDHDVCLLSAGVQGVTYGANGKWVNDHLNEWIHVAMTWNVDATQMVFYVNGANTQDFRNFGTSPGTANFNLPNNLYLGGPDPGAHSNRSWFDGCMDDVLIYNRALSPSEVQQIYTDSLSP